MSRVWRDATGPWVAKVALDDMNALRLSATGCLTALTVSPEGVEMRDFVADHGKTFEYTKADGTRLAKSFRGLSAVESEHELLKQHVSKLPAVYRQHNRNEFCPGFGGGLPMLPTEYRKAMRDGLFRKQGGPSRVNPNSR